MTNFNKLFKETKTDKCWHKYGLAYSMIINSLIDDSHEKLKIMEIGVRKGHSIHSWAKSGLFSEIVGVDIRDEVEEDIKLEIDDLCDYTFELMNAYTDENIKTLLKKYGKFDIIVDDGSHLVKHQQIFLKRYWNFLEDGGVLVCEDVASANIPEFTQMLNNMGLYILDLRLNRPASKNKFDDDILILRYNHNNR